MSIHSKVATPKVAIVKTIIITGQGLVHVVFEGQALPNLINLKADSYAKG